VLPTDPSTSGQLTPFVPIGAAGTDAGASRLRAGRRRYGSRTVVSEYGSNVTAKLAPCTRVRLREIDVLPLPYR
jgi:hypothetical protein